MTSGPLTWVRVIDCSAGRLAMAGALLAEYGADVIRVDLPGGGDDTEATVRATHDRGKRSITLDPERAEDRDRLRALLGTADVMIESWSPGYTEKIDVGFDAVRESNPALVWATITGWGEGRLARGQAWREPLVDAWIGTMGEQAMMATFMRGRPGPPSRQGPLYYGLPMASTGASYLAVIGILGALYRRIDDGRGRRVSTSLVDGALAYLSCPWHDADVAPPPINPGRNFVSYVKCGDGQYLGIHTGAVGAFDRLMVAIGLDHKIPPATGSAASFAMAFTPEDVAVLDTDAPRIFATRSRDDWEEVLTDADVCCVPCLHPGELFDHPQVQANDMAVIVVDPELGETTQIGVATRFSRTPGSVAGPAPRPGEHNEAIAAEQGVPRSATTPPAEPDTRPLLAGVRVLDLGQYYAGPFGVRLLGDLGADVVKLEPLNGDPLRGMDPGGPSEAAQFRKRSIAVDLKSEAGRQIALRLVRWADAIHHNMRPGVAERLGLGYDAAMSVNPSIIYDFAPGWGGGGPYVSRQGFAPMYSGFVGAAFEVTGDHNPPIPPVGHEDPGNGLLGAAGILAALLHRRQTGEGQMIEHSQLSATMTHMRHVLRTPGGEVLGTIGIDAGRVGTGPFDRIYQAQDGWVCVSARDDAEQRALSNTAVQLSGIAPPAVSSSEAIAAWLEQAFANQSADGLSRALSAAGVPNEQATMKNCHRILGDPDNLAARRVYEWTDPAGRGRVREVDHLVRITDAELPAGRERPLLGEHTAELLAEIGYSEAEVDQLREAGVVRMM